MDDVDIAQARQELEMSLTLAARKPPGEGRSHCINPMCLMEISEVRRKLGAERCVDCQEDYEYLQRTYGTR